MLNVTTLDMFSFRGIFRDRDRDRDDRRDRERDRDHDRDEPDRGEEIESWRRVKPLPAKEDIGEPKKESSWRSSGKYLVI